MSKIWSIALKEMSGYFKSPVAYIFLALTLALFNVFFYMIVDQNRDVSLKSVFQVMEFLFVFLAPLLTMRIFAEERASGTLELLMTSPLTNTAIVLGKYLGTLLFFSVLIAFTLVYYGIVAFYGQPDHKVILAGYLGIWLEGAFFLAVGVMTSSWTRHQVAAAMMAYFILFLSYFSISFNSYVTGFAAVLVRQMGTWSHLENFADGLITAGDFVYFISGICVCLFLTRVCIENRWWR
jgi:ABC-2 type transport system permease protein